MKTLLILAMIVATAAADQITKLAVLRSLSPGEIYSVSPGFNLTLGFNEGASFGMMSDLMAGRPLLMVALTGALAITFAGMAFRADTRREGIGLALIVGGAVGNIIDRLRQGAVTDFLDVYWRDWHWPTFNGADIAISLGALLVLTAMLRPSRSKELSFDRT